MSQDAGASLPTREYRHGIRLSVVGFGGIIVVGMDSRDAGKAVSGAIDSGVNYFDVAPSYWDGEAEIKLGDALRGKRDSVFLACKTNLRDAAGAERELAQSLARAHTDRFDLYQFHAVTTPGEVDRICGAGGASEAVMRARADGRILHVGASCHSVEAALALMDRLPLDSLLFPVNFACWHNGNFGPQVMAEAGRRGIRVLALKSLAHTPWGRDETHTYEKCWYKPVDDRSIARDALRFTLSRGVCALIPPGEETLFRMALGLVKELGPEGLAMSAPEEAAFVKVAASGVVPLFTCPSREIPGA
ncbi:MAG: aldo/keto reductase [Spirochaetes bacterium]|nr:aldo/keto reductase [Spirochaetota bacterium]